MTQPRGLTVYSIYILFSSITFIYYNRKNNRILKNPTDSIFGLPVASGFFFRLSNLFRALCSDGTRSGKGEWSPVSKHQIQSGCGEKLKCLTTRVSRNIAKKCFGAFPFPSSETASFVPLQLGTTYPPSTASQSKSRKRGVELWP